MDYLDTGFANVRLPNDDNSYIYRYDSRINTFPEEVYIHEFLHTLERVVRENGKECPLLHDYEKYGYENKKLEGQREWYADFMTKSINDNGTYIGLDPIVYTLKPTHQEDFEHSISIEIDNNPDNIFEEINSIIKAFTYKVRMLQEAS